MCAASCPLALSRKLVMADKDYILSQIILAFQLVLTNDRLEDRRIEEVIVFLFLYYTFTD